MTNNLFNNAEEVGQFFGRTFDAKRTTLINAFLATGERPDPGGCWHCLESDARRVTGWIDLYAGMVEQGTAQDWREGNIDASSVGLPYGSDWG